MPVQFDEHPPALRRAPEHGEHSELVLLELGYTWEQIGALQAARGDPVTRGDASGAGARRARRRRSGKPPPRTCSTVARCSRCGTFSIPPDIVCPHCHSTVTPTFAFEPVSGRGSLRSWTVVRQSFLPGFDDDLPFVLVDVELDEQADLRMIGRLLDGPDAALHLGDRVVVAFEDIAAGRRRSRAFAAASRPLDHESRRVHGARPGRDRRVRAEPGAASRDRGRSAPSRSTPRARAIADAGLDVAQIDGFTTGALFPTAGAHTIEDGVSIVTLELAGRAPRRSTRATRRASRATGRSPARSRMAVNAVATGAADYVLMHRALHNPAGQLPRQPDARSARRRAVDGAAGLLRAAGDDRVAVQRVPPALRRAT